MASQVLVTFLVGVVLGILAFYFVFKYNKKQDAVGQNDQLEKRVVELKEALDNSEILIRDRGLALENKTKEFLETKFQFLELDRELTKERERYAVLLNQKKSTEVRIGQISEQIAPFLHAWPYKAGNFRFLGSPIDGVSFEEDEVVFVEIKTGKSRLSPTQLRIRKLVKEGKVKWVEFRIDPDGFNIKED